MTTSSSSLRRRAAGVARLQPGSHQLEVPPPPALPHLASIQVLALGLVDEHGIPDVHAHAGAIATGIPHARHAVLQVGIRLHPELRIQPYNSRGEGAP